MAIITPSRQMETLMLAIVRNVRRRLRQQFFRTRGRNRNMRVILVYEFPRPRVCLWFVAMGADLDVEPAGRAGGSGKTSGHEPLVKAAQSIAGGGRGSAERPCLRRRAGLAGTRAGAHREEHVHAAGDG